MPPEPQSHGADASADDVAAAQNLVTAYEKLRAEMSTVIVGQESVIEELFIALFCSGHCILEGVPGLAKTLMISTLSRLLSLSFSRIQFTPDLMPSDITGTEVIEEDRGPVPVLCDSSRVRFSPTWSWRMRSTGLRPRRRQPCSKRCRRTR